MAKHNVSEFLKMKGAPDLFIALEGGRKSYNELEENLPMSPNTVLNRLREAQDLGLVEETLERQESGRSNIKYGLTQGGREVLETIDSVKGDYKKLRREALELQKELQEKEKKIKDLVGQKIMSEAKVVNSVLESQQGDITVVSGDVYKGSEKKKEWRW